MQHSEPQWFSTTHWSVVLSARDSKSEKAEAAMQVLCQSYWPPIFTYLLKKGYSHEDAKDLVQEFFLYFLEKGLLSQLTHQRGKFRSFLLTCLKHFVSDQWDKQRAQKRGGGKVIISIDSFDPEERYLIEPADSSTAEEAFDRGCAETILRLALDRLRKECEEQGKSHFLNFLQRKGNEDDQAGYAEVAVKWGLTESGVKAAVKRLRERYSQLIRLEVSKTVGTKSEVDEEIRYLLSLLAKGS